VGKSKVLTHEGMVRVYWKKKNNESPGRERRECHMFHVHA